MVYSGHYEKNTEHPVKDCREKIKGTSASKTNWQSVNTVWNECNSTTKYNEWLCSLEGPVRWPRNWHDKKRLSEHVRFDHCHSHGSRREVASDPGPVGVGVRQEAATEVVAAAVQLRREAIISHHVPRVTHVHWVLQLDTVEGAVGATAAHGDVELKECGRRDAEVPSLGVTHPPYGTVTSVSEVTKCAVKSQRKLFTINNS